MKKKVLIVIAVIVLVYLIVSTVAMGFFFMGPLKSLAVYKVHKKYNADVRQGEIVFYGASNFALWTEMENDLADYKVQNHGFGGSADADLMKYADKLLYPYQPQIVVFQTGSNDYTQEEGSDEDKLQICMDRKRTMFEMFHEKLPDARFIVMSGLLLPGRAEYLDLTKEVNQSLEELCDEYDYLTFVDASDMTYDGNAFKIDLFKDDQIHLNHEGQLKWAKEYILPALDEAVNGLGDDGHNLRN